jgi:tetratricopeptide (TPR) repeat protein
VNLLGPLAQSGGDLLEIRLTHFKLAACWAQLGDNERSRKHFDEAQEWHRRYLATFVPGTAIPPSVRIRFVDETCMSLECIADWPELEQQARTLFAEIAEAQRLNPALPLALYERANAGYFLGRALLEQGRAKEAIPIFREAVKDSEEEYAQHRPAPPVDHWSLFVRGGVAEALVASGNRQEARAELEKNLAAWDALVAASPAVTWDARAKQAEVGFLLATVLDSTDPQEAKRRQSLLDRAVTFFENHPAGNPLNWHDAELLAKIKTLRSAGSDRVPETVSITTSPL